MAKKNSSILWTVAQTGDNGIGKDGRDQAQKNVGLDTLYSNHNSANGYYVKYLHQDTTTNNIVAAQAQTATTYSSNSDAPISGKGVAAAITTLKLNNAITNTASRTVSTVTESNGIISMDFQNIEIGGDQVTLADASQATDGNFVKVDAAGNLSVSTFNGNDHNEITCNKTASNNYKTGQDRTITQFEQQTNGQISVKFEDILIGGNNVKISNNPETDKQKFVMVSNNGYLTISSLNSSGWLTERSYSPEASKTIEYLVQNTQGQISATFQDIAIKGTKVTIDDSAVSEFVSTKSDGTLIHSKIHFSDASLTNISTDDYIVIGKHGTPTGADTWYTENLKFHASDPYRALAHNGQWLTYTTAYIADHNSSVYAERRQAKLGITDSKLFSPATGTFQYNPCVTGNEVPSTYSGSLPNAVIYGYLVPKFTSNECTWDPSEPVDNVGKVLAITKVDDTEKLAWEYRSGPYILNMSWIEGNDQFADLSTKLTKLLRRLMELCNSSDPKGASNVPDSMIKTGDTTKTMVKAFVYKSTGNDSTVEWHELVRVEKDHRQYTQSQVASDQAYLLRLTFACYSSVDVESPSSSTAWTPYAVPKQYLTTYTFESVSSDGSTASADYQYFKRVTNNSEYHFNYIHPIFKEQYEAPMYSIDTSGNYGTDPRVVYLL